MTQCGFFFFLFCFFFWTALKENKYNRKWAGVRIGVLVKSFMFKHVEHRWDRRDEEKSCVINVSVLTCIHKCTHTSADSTRTSAHVLAHCSVPSEGTITDRLTHNSFLYPELEKWFFFFYEFFFLHLYKVKLYSFIQTVHRNNLDVQRHVWWLF